jgi:hypothetical protein
MIKHLHLMAKVVTRSLGLPVNEHFKPEVSLWAAALIEIKQMHYGVNRFVGYDEGTHLTHSRIEGKKPLSNAFNNSPQPNPHKHLLACTEGEAIVPLPCRHMHLSASDRKPTGVLLLVQRRTQVGRDLNTPAIG